MITLLLFCSSMCTRPLFLLKNKACPFQRLQAAALAPVYKHGPCRASLPRDTVIVGTPGSVRATVGDSIGRVFL